MIVGVKTQVRCDDDTPQQCDYHCQPNDDNAKQKFRNRMPTTKQATKPQQCARFDRRSMHFFSLCVFDCLFVWVVRFLIGLGAKMLSASGIIGNQIKLDEAIRLFCMHFTQSYLIKFDCYLRTARQTYCEIVANKRSNKANRIELIIMMAQKCGESKQSDAIYFSTPSLCIFFGGKFRCIHPIDSNPNLNESNRIDRMHHVRKEADE